MRNPFRCFDSSPEVIRLAVLMYVRYPLSLRQVEDLLFERGIDICHETVRFWWNRFGPMFAAEIRRHRVQSHSYSQWRSQLTRLWIEAWTAANLYRVLVSRNGVIAASIRRNGWCKFSALLLSSNRAPVARQFP